MANLRHSSQSAHRASLAENDPAATPQWLADLQRTVFELEPHQRIFLGRAVQAVLELTHLDEDSLVRAAESRTDADVLIRALQSPSALQTIEQVEPLAGALLEGITARRELIEQGGGTYTSQQAASALGITTQAIHKRRMAGRLIGLYMGKQGYLYPVWQFDGSGTLPGLEQVLERLHDIDAWMQAVFFLNPNPQLDGTRPLDALRSGQLEEVVEVASTIGEHGAL
ncbi:MAG TPA: hypothetical protein VFB63_21270 [Bryobacteraceae bacterium]|nr:hypothetical protein [Bryobacteraceae bacterium]